MIGAVLFAPHAQNQKSRGFWRWSRRTDSVMESPTLITSTEIGISRLGVFSLFAGLDTEAMFEIARSAKDRWVKAGTVVIRQGQIGKEIYLLEAGSGAIYTVENDRRRLIAVIQAPTVFGEMAVMNPERIRTSNVKAITNLKLLVIPISEFVLFLRRFAALRNNLIGIVNERTPAR